MIGDMFEQFLDVWMEFMFDFIMIQYLIYPLAN